MQANETLSIRPRYELKYLVDLETSRRLVERLLPDAEPDSHGKHGGYHVNSVYYDTDDFLLYLEKIDGTDPRFKVRNRYYGDLDPETDLNKMSSFLEIKHRQDRCISKDRIQVNAVSLAEHEDSRRLVLDPDQVMQADSADSVELVRHTIDSLPLYPLCSVSYFRQAFHFKSNPTLRITVDTGLRSTAALSGHLVPAMDGNPFLPQDMAVAEVKFHWSMPLWLLEILREFGMQSRPYSKYCSALESLFPDHTLRNIGYQNTWVGGR